MQTMPQLQNVLAYDLRVGDVIYNQDATIIKIDEFPNSRRMNIRMKSNSGIGYYFWTSVNNNTTIQVVKR